MSKILFLIGLFSFSSFAQVDEIKKVIGDYATGYQEANTELIQKSFHPETRLLSVDEGKFDVTEMKDWLKGLEERQARGDLRRGKLSIKSIDVKDYTAFVKLVFQFEKFTFTDYLSLLKIDGKWMIVGKIYHYQAHETL